ncbi:MAG: FAD binding domain-containing protein [Bradymonadia bacterium]
MLPIKNNITVLTPSTLDEALNLLNEHQDQVRIMAGGTDLIPNLKHGLYDETRLLSLHRIPNLSQIEVDDTWFSIGAGVTLSTLATNSDVMTFLPAVREAANLVASPQIRQTATVGGNLCLDTRCVYINQSHFWRSALGYCLKKDGTKCHVVETGKRCVAAASNDLATILMSLSAEICIRSSTAMRWIQLKDFYRSDGVWNKHLSRNELLVSVRVPLSATRRAMSYQKLRRRGSIDFPWLSLGLSFEFHEGVAQDICLVVSAIAARPKLIRLPTQPVVLCDEAIEDIAMRVFRQVRPLSNIDADISWRREMVKVLTHRAFTHATGVRGESGTEPL